MEIKTTEQIVNDKGNWWMDTKWVRVDDEIKFLKRIYDCLIIMRTKKDIDIDTLAIVIKGRLNELSQSSQ